LTYDTYDPNSGSAFDWTHGNTCVYDPKENAVYLSLRNLSRIVKVDYASGRILWSMGLGMQSGQADFGDNLFSFQHSPELQPNGNILLYDNGNRRDHAYQDPPKGCGYSSGVEIALDWSRPEPATIVWEYILPIFTPAYGDADRLANGNTLLTAGFAPDALLVEVSPASDTVWQMRLVGHRIYRSNRVPSLYASQYNQPYATTTAPSDLFQPGWVWFSLPLVPRWSGDPCAVLGFDCTNRLYGWDDAAKNLLLYPNELTDVEVGAGYVARLSVGESHVPSYEGVEPDSPFEQLLPAAGWCWVGPPGIRDVLGTDLHVSKAGVSRTAAEDAVAPDPWINWNWIFWDPTLHVLGIMDPFGGGDDVSLHPWWGYRVWANTENVTLIFP